MRVAVDGGATLTFEPTREGVLSWNTFSERGLVEFRLLRAGVPSGPWMKYAQWNSDGRQSFSAEHSGADANVRVDVDVIRSTQPFDGMEIRAGGVDFKALAFAAPVHASPSMPYLGEACILDVPARTQYVLEEERGWCSPTAVSMINAYHGIDYGVAYTARGVFDRAYNGTGNWAFNVAFSGTLGLRAAVVYLRNLDHAQRFIEAGLPLAISYGWGDGELPGAPLTHSDGHLAVLRGFTANGDCAMNDPAAPHIRVVYSRSAIEKIWQRNKCVAYAIAPVGIDFLHIVNA